MARNTKRIDVELVADGSTVTFVPKTNASKAWLRRETSHESWQWFGSGLVVHHRYASDLKFAMIEAGFTITGP